MKSLITILYAVILLLTSSICIALTNPSFEFVHEGTTPGGLSTEGNAQAAMPDDWSWRKRGALDGYALDGLWSSDGTRCLYMYAIRGNAHTAGDYLEFYQSVDLTDVQSILFDVVCDGRMATESYLAIDSQKQWTFDTIGSIDHTFLNSSIDVSTLTGVHEISMGIELFKDFASRNADGHTRYDNIRLIPIPEPATITLLALGGLILRKRRV